MSNNEHQNDSCYQEQGLAMQDRDILTMILELEKNMSNNYSIAMNEASNDDLYESFFDMFTNVKDMTRDIFDLMNHLGWYKIEYVEESKITKKIKEFNQKLDCLEQ